MYSATELNKFISAASFLLSCCFSEIQILYSYRSVGTTIILPNFNNDPLLIFSNVLRIFPHNH